MSNPKGINQYTGKGQFKQVRKADKRRAKAFSLAPSARASRLQSSANANMTRAVAAAQKVFKKK